MGAPPLLAGRFEVLGRIGSGSSGEVLRVRDQETGRVLALKLLRPRGIAGPAQLARAFHREFHVLAALRHPHLVAVHDHGVLEASEGEDPPGTADAAWFTMELVAGRPIDEALAGADAVTIARVADALLDALGALHRRGLVHGDVKAANILVGEDLSSDPPPVRLMDFGLVARAGRTEPGVLRGTPATLAPEALRGTALDGRADLYALGCVLYRVVAGQDPFLGTDAWDVVRAHLSVVPTPPRDLVPGVAPLLEQLILALLEKDPARRPPTAEEARRRLAPLSGAAAAPAVALATPLAGEFVGREPQLAAWREAVAAHDAPGGGFWSVRGLAGSGRSRLLEEFLLEAHAAGRPAVLVAPHDVPPRPLGLVDALELALSRSGRSAAPPDEGATRAERVLARLAGLPFVLLVDDVDDADPASREVLLTLAAEAASGALPSLVVFAVRDGDSAAGPGFALPDGATERTPLAPLRPAESARALASMIGTDALPSAWQAELAAATAGRPGAIARVAETLVATGRVGPGLALPATLEAALAGAPSGAAWPEGAEARALVAALAVAGGGPLPLVELEQLEPRAARDAGALDGLVASGTVRRVVDAEGRVGVALAARRAAPDALALASPAALAALHARRSQQLAGVPGSEEERGRHLAAIGRSGEALALFAAAAVRALEEGLPRTAVRLADDALALPDPGADLGPRLTAGLRGTRAAALAALGSPREAEAEASRAIDAARSAADPHAMAESLRGAAVLASARGDLAAAVARLEESLSLLDDLGEVGLGAEVLLEGGRALARAGRAADAETRLASALGQARRSGRADVEAGALVALGELALAGGRSAEALERFRAAEDRTRAAGGAGATAAARRGRVLALEAGGRAAEALDEARLLRSEARAAHRLDDEAEAAAIGGRLLAQLGRRREAQESLRAAAARRRRLGQPHEAAALAAREALLLLERGQSRAALALAHEAQAEAERCAREGATAETRAALAVIAAARGDVTEVDARLPARGDAPLAEQALRALLRGRALAGRGDGEAAREALQEGCFLARRGGFDRLEFEGLLALAELSLERGDEERMQLALRRARQAAETAGWEEGVARARLLAAERELARGRGGAAAAREDAAAAASVLAAHERGDLAWRALAAEAEAARLADAEADAAILARAARRALETWLAAAPEADRERLAAHPRARALVLAGPPAADRGPVPTSRPPSPAEETPDRARHEAELERLLAINRALNSSLEPRAVLSILVDTAIEMTGAERGFVLLDQGGESLVEIARGSGGAQLDGSEREMARGVAREVMREGRPLLAVDALTDARLAASVSIHALAIRSLLATPLAVRGEAAGAIVLDSRRAAATFDAGHLEMVGRLADQAGIALGNARLVDELRRQADEIRHLNDRLARQVEDQRIEIREKQSSLEVRFRYDSLVGASPAMQRVYRILDKIVPTRLPVLITGESGTGKDLVARVVHYNGPRREQRFVTVNCAALTETLLESELFGHRRGAYTGADRDRKGLFEQADGGTLLLDEIGEMPMHLQPKLLRAIQFGEIRRLGEDMPRQVDVRIVAATNRELAAAVREGRFREDLLYRLDVARVHLAPLRERIEDVGLLVDALLEGLASRAGTAAKRLEPAALRLFLRHDWPGNVRELEHELTKLAAFVDGDVITELDVMENCSFHERAPKRAPAAAGPVATLEEIEVEQIRQALRAAKGNRSRAAEMLGIDRSTLYRKLRRLGEIDETSS